MSAFEVKPIWDEVTLPTFEPPTRDLSVDVAVIGAGLTGVTTAWLLKQAGCRVALLERRSVGGVDTGCTTAHLTAVSDADLTTLASSFGRDHAQAVWDAGLAAIDQIDAIVREGDIDCDFRWVPGFRHVPFDADDRAREEALEQLRAEADLARELGFDVEMVSSAPLVGQPGWRIENQALFHPRKYLKALLARLPGSGSVVHEQCEVTFGDDPERLSCAGRTVQARHVVIATHNPLAGRLSATDASLLQTNLFLYTSYVLGARLKKAAADIPAASWWDTAQPYHYVRVEDDGEGGLRIIAGGEDHKTGQMTDTRDAFDALERWFQTLMPNAVVTNRWSGQVIETPDGLPFIGEIVPRQYIATGFAGNGMTFGTLAAMIVRDAIAGGVPNPWRDLFDVHRSAISRGPLDYLRENADYPYYLLRDRVAGASTRELRRVARGEGRLVEIDGQVVAASRDTRGRLTLLSPTCTHLGCRVDWNRAEGTWDCPCHGSRYNATGEVLAGPAERPLEAATLKPMKQSGAAVAEQAEQKGTRRRAAGRT